MGIPEGVNVSCMIALLKQYPIVARKIMGIPIDVVWKILTYITRYRERQEQMGAKEIKIVESRHTRNQGFALKQDTERQAQVGTKGAKT